MSAVAPYMACVFGLIVSGPNGGPAYRIANPKAVNPSPIKAPAVIIAPHSALMAVSHSVENQSENRNAPDTLQDYLKVFRQVPIIKQALL